MDDFAAVESRLTEAHPTLSPQLRKAATYVLDNPGEIATQSMRAVAARSGVPFANFSRLAQTIGFSTYNDLREVYRRHVQSGVGTGYPARAERLQASGRISGDDAIWTSFRESALSNVTEIYNRVDSQAISAITNELLKRDRIFIAGMQASYPIASYLDYVGGMVRPNLVILGRQGDVTADDITDLGDRDAIICLAIRPCARLTVKLAELASKRGAYVLGITDSRASPLFAKSTDTLLVPCHSPHFSNHTLAP